MDHKKLSLKVSLDTDKARYGIRDEINIRVLLTNTSASPLYIYAPIEWGESASLSLWMKDMLSGRDLQQTIIADSLPPPPVSKDEFIELLPNHIYGVVLMSKLSQLNIEKKGTYELTIEYHSPIPASMSFHLPAWTREDGTVSSNRVTIKVEADPK
ncbi:MAG TPA: hypothetical protein VJN64_00980 [Terriglobales bacterium]|nr:hypothetical protein [Terriglobales bacterium]